MATALILLLTLVVAVVLARLVALIASDGLGSRDDRDLPRSTRHHMLEGLG